MIFFFTFFLIKKVAKNQGHPQYGAAPAVEEPQSGFNNNSPIQGVGLLYVEYISEPPEWGFMWVYHILSTTLFGVGGDSG